MKDVQCKKCLKKFAKKDIYTIQQFQYRQIPSYDWSKQFFAAQNIGEWDSFCESCITQYKQISFDEYKKASS